MLHIGGEHVGENRGEKSKIKKAVPIREAVRAGEVPSLRVVALVVNVRQLEMKAFIIGRDFLLAPVNRAANDIEPPVLPLLRQVMDQRDGHTPASTAHIQHATGRFQSTHLSKVPKEFLTDSLEIAAADTIN